MKAKKLMGGKPGFFSEVSQGKTKNEVCFGEKSSAKRNVGMVTGTMC